jgi:hypothetical protein
MSAGKWQRSPQVDISGFVTRKLDTFNNTDKMPTRWSETQGLGIANTWLDEPVPEFPWNKEGGFRYLTGKNNSMIELGRDMPSNHWSGHGGSGHTQAGSIDLVAGRLAPNMNETVTVGKNFSDDAARVYIAQKTDIDTNFGIDPGQIGTVANRSGVALKADAVRMISRDGGIKLITGGAQNTKSRARTGEGEGSNFLQAFDSVFSERNSVGGFTMNPAPGIEFIAGNSSESHTSGFMGSIRSAFGREDTVETLQPLVMGDNTVIALNGIIDIIDNLNDIVGALARTQRKFNSKIAIHTHIAAGFGAPTTPSILLMGAAFPMYAGYLQVGAMRTAHKLEQGVWKINYTFPLATRYICSENVRTT